MLTHDRELYAGVQGTCQLYSGERGQYMLACISVPMNSGSLMRPAQRRSRRRGDLFEISGRNGSALTAPSGNISVAAATHAKLLPHTICRYATVYYCVLLYTTVYLHLGHGYIKINIIQDRTSACSRQAHAKTQNRESARTRGQTLYDALHRAPSSSSLVTHARWSSVGPRGFTRTRTTRPPRCARHAPSLPPRRPPRTRRRRPEPGCSAT